MLLVDVLLEVATGSLLMGAAGAGAGLVAAGSGVTVDDLLALMLAEVFVATFASDFEEFLLLRVGAGVGVGVGRGVASATLAGASRGVVAVVDETSAAADALGAVSVSAVLFCATGVGALISLSLMLWSNSSAPPITDAVMIPNASPKWFIVLPIEH